MTWCIDGQPLEYQVRYWRARAEGIEKQLAAERRRKTPPERVELDKACDDYKILEIRHGHLQEAIEGFVRVQDELRAEIAALKAGTVIERLERERDHWKHLWRNCTQRLADAIEHSGTYGYMPVASRNED